MSRLSVVFAVVVMCGCRSNPVARPTHWVHVVDFIEEYDRCIRESDGRVLIEVMHAHQSNSELYHVFKNGAGYGEYATREQAKAAAIRLLPECAAQQTREGSEP